MRNQPWSVMVRLKLKIDYIYYQKILFESCTKSIFVKILAINAQRQKEMVNLIN